MDLVKSSKDIVKNVEEKIEKGLEVVKDTFDNVARHLPFSNLLKHNSDSYGIEIDLPGVKKEDIELKVEDDYLTVNAIRRFRNELKEDDYYLCESSFGRISRSFALGENINRDTIQAKYEEGRLYLTFEKVEAKKARTITIK
jgi:HSP20 family protein